MNLTGPNVFVVDIECDALLDDLTKLHVMSIGWVDQESGQWRVSSTNNPERIQTLIGNPNNVIIGHNFIQYDKRALIKLGYTFNAQIIDTLGLSWYLYADMQKHGLEVWGELLGVHKVEISDWQNLSYDEYRHRCEEDVKININLWVKFLDMLSKLYDDEIADITRVISIWNFKLEIGVIQENNPIKLNKELAESNNQILLKVIEEKSDILRQVMPKIPVMAIRSKPKTMYKKPVSKPAKMFLKSGELTPSGLKWVELLESKGLPEDHSEPITEYSASGEKWVSLLRRAGLPDDYEGEIKEVVKMEDANPGSSAQVKDWLFSLGWVPKIFEDGANGPVPQLMTKDKELCESVLELKSSAPEIEHLEGLSVAKHRSGILKGFLKHMRPDGTLVAEFGKSTRTFRFAHKGAICNVPSNTSTHGELIRVCLEAPKGFDFVNADLEALESKCSTLEVSPWASYEYIHKPDDYDPHIEVSVAANLMSHNEGEFYKWYKNKGEEENCPEEFKNLNAEQRKSEIVRLGDVRKKGKTSNYSIIYGVGPFKLSKALNCSMEEAKRIINAYWKIHKPVKDFTATLKTKEFDGRTWVWNPFTKLFLQYKGEHNLFSACTQNFGAIVHLRLLYFYIQHGIKPIMNIHDEVSWYWPKGQQQECKQIVATCVDLLNQSFGFDIKFEAAPEFANNYGGLH